MSISARECECVRGKCVNASMRVYLSEVLSVSVNDLHTGMGLGCLGNLGVTMMPPGPISLRRVAFLDYFTELS